MRLLEIGAKVTREGWDNIGLEAGIIHDCTFPMPFEPDTYDGIFSEHFIEHLHKHEGIRHLKDCKRILKPEGTIRIAWPAYEHIEWLTCEENEGKLNRHPYVRTYKDIWDQERERGVNPSWAVEPDPNKSVQENVTLNLLEQNGEHKYLWPVKEMIDTLAKIGYTNVLKIKTQKSRIEQFKNIEETAPCKMFETTIVEATA